MIHNWRRKDRERGVGGYSDRYTMHWTLNTPGLNGYDVHQQAAGSMFPRRLSGRRELVEQLDSEPLFDYLVQNGVLERPLVNDIKNEKSPAKVNLALLRHVEDHGKPAVNLFVNALRVTGQHNLASLLDDSTRIKALSGSGYLSKSRHKGQLTLNIQVHALRLPSESFTTTSLAPSREWVSLDDIMLQMNALRNPLLSRPPTQQFEVIEIPEAEEKKSSSCLCGCFAKLFSKKKSSKAAQKQKQKNMVAALAQQHQVQTTSNGSNCNENNGKNSRSSTLNNRFSLGDPHALRPESMCEADLRLSVENLENVADTIRSKSEEFYDILKNTTSSIYVGLLKYFEQNRGVLVLATGSENGFEITSICTKSEQIEQFRRDHTSGKLDRDVENCIVKDDILERIGALGMRLVTKLDLEELELCEQELA